MHGYLKNINKYPLLGHEFLTVAYIGLKLRSRAILTKSFKKTILQQSTISKPMMTLPPREAGKFIVEHAKYVKVHQNGIDKLSKEIMEGILSKKIDVRNFSQHELHPKPTDVHAVEWIFLIDTLNFCFWTPKNYTKYKVNGYTGYFALCAAVNRALSEGIPITDSKFYSSIDEPTLAKILRSDDGETKVPLLKERVQCLHEVGKILLASYEGKFENMIIKSNKSAVKLLNMIVDEFACFRDTAVFEEKAVALYKRAQILVGDIWACFAGNGLGEFSDIGAITMFADYRVPQVLVHYGALEYTHELLEVLKKDTLLANGDPMEVEIRGASIHIVEMVKDAVLLELEKHPELPKESVNSILIDHFLWDYRRQHAEELDVIPFHKVLSIYY